MMTYPSKTSGLVAGTIACALAIGWGTQTFVARTQAAVPTHGTPVVTASMLGVPAAAIAGHTVDHDTPAPAPAAETVTRSEADLLDTDLLPARPADQLARLPECDITALAVPAPRASVTLTVDAPCYPGAQLSLHHTGLMFSALTDDAGHLSVTVPALRDHAVFILSFDHGPGTVVSADVPDVGHWSRVALQWQGPTGFEIHALELGAGYGDTGHVWAGAPGNPMTGSFLERLGDGTGPDARVAEVYSFPRGSGLNGLVALSVEAEVTAETCARALTAEVLERRDAGTLTSRDLDLTMPNCAAIGDFLVLNNLVDDLKIAAN